MQSHAPFEFWFGHPIFMEERTITVGSTRLSERYQGGGCYVCRRHSVCTKIKFRQNGTHCVQFPGDSRYHRLRQNVRRMWLQRCDIRLESVAAASDIRQSCPQRLSSLQDHTSTNLLTCGIHSCVFHPDAYILRPECPLGLLPAPTCHTNFSLLLCYFE